MNTRDWTKEEAEVISMEEYLAKERRSEKMKENIRKKDQTIAKKV